MCKSRDGEIVNENCHNIIDLSDFGIDGLIGRGCIADADWIGEIVVPCHISSTDPSCILCIPTRKVYSLTQLEHGKHGIIDGGKREIDDTTHLVMIKRAKDYSKSLLQEALLQSVVYSSLCRRGFPNGASRVYDIIGLRNNTACFSMEPMKGMKLNDLIKQRIGFDLVNIIVESLFHISTMLWNLIDDIGMNHRDLKPNNIIIRIHEPVSKIIKVADMSFTINSQLEVSIIDFGFSCVGVEGGKGGGSLNVGAGYDPEDPCPKEGRDMYMFLAFMFFYTHIKLPVDMTALFERWLNVEGCNMTGFLKSPVAPKEKREVMDWIYKLTGDPQVVRFNTTPERIVRDLQDLIAST
jgi:serine/threonine protein kinase